MCANMITQKVANPPAKTIIAATNQLEYPLSKRCPPAHEWGFEFKVSNVLRSSFERVIRKKNGSKQINNLSMLQRIKHEGIYIYIYCSLNRPPPLYCLKY